MRRDISDYKKKQKVKIIVLSLIGIVLVSHLFTFFSIYSLKSNQDEMQNEFGTELDRLSSSYESQLESVRTRNQENLERMGEFIIETRSEYQQKTENLLQIVEETEKQNDIRLAELRQELNNLNKGDITELVNNVIKSAVSVSTNRSQGSGVVISDDGYIVTNSHVIKNEPSATVIDFNGRAASARVVLNDPGRDLVILKTEADFEGIAIGDSSDILVGEKVVAIGSPERLDFTVTQGIVSAASRTFDETEGEFIQTDVPINSGSSGGPLINMDGELIGINTFKIRGSESLGFAIPSNDVEELLSAAKSS